MNKYFLTVLAIFTLTASAQDLPGYRSGNYTGVNGVFFNPANIADSRYRWDFNLFSLGINVGNTQASFNLKNIGQTINNDSLIHQFTGKNAGTYSGIFNASIHGPSFFFNAGKNAAIALTSRTRIIVNAMDIDGILADHLSEDSKKDPQLPYTINSNDNMRIRMNAWTEFGLSYARVIKDEGEHFIKGGITLKYLNGAANGYANLASFTGTINQDPVTNYGYLANSTSRIALGLGGINISDFSAQKLISFHSAGFGGDIGFVYEYRPDHEKYKLDSTNSWSDFNKYKFKIGVALLDLGAIRYERDIQRSGSYDINIDGANKLYFKELTNVPVDSLKNYFDTHPQFFTPAAGNNGVNYKVGLPTSLHIDADYHFQGGLYVNFAAQFNLVNTIRKPYSSQYYSSFTLTPRYEGRRVGLYVPLSYNKLTNFNAGLSLRLGPLFIGSGCILTALLGKSKQADVYIGLRLGGLQKNIKKKTENKKNEEEKIPENND